MSADTSLRHAFPRNAHAFLRQLAGHNDRDWFAAHRDEYRTRVLDPAREFVAAAGRRLGKLVPGLHADPRANGQGSISPIRRDTRFLADKTPYRSFLGILFWTQAAERKWDSPGFHLVLEPNRVKLSAGIRRFTPAQLPIWRDYCRDLRLHRSLTRLEKTGVSLGGSHYKRAPAGCEDYAADYGARSASLALHRGLFVTREFRVKASLCGEAFLDACLESWRPMAAVNRWLLELDDLA